MDYVGIIKQRKIIGGMLYRKYFIDSEGKEVGIPPYIGLVTIGNKDYVYVKPNKKKMTKCMYIYEPYHDKQTQIEKLERCIKIVKTLVGHEYTTSPPKRQTVKRTKGADALGLDVSDVPSGVVVSLHKTKTPFVSIVVSYFEPLKRTFTNKYIYVGNMNTWKQNYARKLQEAITLREDSLKLYNKLTSQNENAETTAA